MKKLLLFPLFAMLALLSACSSDDDDKQVFEPAVTEAVYKGDLQLGETTFTVKCEYKYDTESNSCNIILKGVTFAAAMPKMDIILENVPCNLKEGMVEFLGSDLTPVMSMGGMSLPAEDYKIEQLQGNATASSMHLKAIMAMGELVFDGALSSGDDEESEEGSAEGEFSGAMTVLAADSEVPFVNEAVRCELLPNEDFTAVDLCIYSARFAENMPVTVDIKLEAIPCEVLDGEIHFACEETFVPLVRMGEEFIPMEAFAFYYIAGICDGESLAFEADMTRGEFVFAGVKGK
ncbi:MAG: hypothetical protein IJY64_08675 [Bacteroidaceae bacterium]|nr:hypothetical protein [Bacteroidaceae bacterium]